MLVAGENILKRQSNENRNDKQNTTKKPEETVEIPMYANLSHFIDQIPPAVHVQCNQTIKSENTKNEDVLQSNDCYLFNFFFFFFFTFPMFTRK